MIELEPAPRRAIDPVRSQLGGLEARQTGQVRARPHNRAWLLLGAAVAMCAAACSTTYREVRLSEPAMAVAPGLRIAVERAFLTDDWIDDGQGQDGALVVELTVSNAGLEAYHVVASAIWCLLEVDVTRPGETRLLPPSVDGEGAFPGQPPEPLLLEPLDVPPGQTRSFWVLFRGYQFPDSDIPRRVTLKMPGAGGQPIELVLADPARGYLRWHVAPARSGWLIGVQNASFLGSYLKGSTTATVISRIASVGPLLWDVGLTETLLVETQGGLSSPTSSFSNIGLEAHLTLPVWRWGAPLDPRRIGFYAGAETQFLTAIMPPPPPDTTVKPIVYGSFEPEVGLEVDVGALRTAATPFPLYNAGRNPIPRWILRYGYTHAWIGHGTSDALVSSIRLVW
jgi:hypothetical protein